MFEVKNDKKKAMVEMLLDISKFGQGKLKEKTFKFKFKRLVAWIDVALSTALLLGVLFMRDSTGFEILLASIILLLCLSNVKKSYD